MKSSQPQTIYLGRDMDYHSSKACDNKNDAISYIQSQSGKGYVEVFQLEQDYYQFKTAEWIGPTNRNSIRGTVFGADLPEGVHKSFIPFILGYIN